MTDLSNNSKPKILIHIIYAITILLVVFSILGYLFWEKTILIENKDAKVKSCIQEASANYINSWSISCAKNADFVRNQLNNCIGQAKYATNLVYNGAFKSSAKNAYLNAVMQCKRTFGEPNSAPDCSLPVYKANDLNAELHSSEQLCMKINS